MKAEWVERLHDQARTEMGFCVQDGSSWCSQHDSLKKPGEEACLQQQRHYAIAESAGEAMQEEIAADIEAERFSTVYVSSAQDIRIGLRRAARIARGES